MAKLTAAQLAGLVRTNIGGAGPASADILENPDTDGPTFVAIALAESGGDTNAIGGPNTNGTKDYGLWQINDVHKQEFAAYWSRWQDPTSNLAMAAALYQNRGGKFTDWSSYNYGRYAPFLPAAQRAWNGEEDTSAADPTAAAQNESSGNPLDPINAVGDFLTLLTKSTTWVRVGMGAAGLVLVLIVVAGVMKTRLPGPVGAIARAAKASKATAPVAEGVAT